MALVRMLSCKITAAAFKHYPRTVEGLKIWWGGGGPSQNRGSFDKAGFASNSSKIWGASPLAPLTPLVPLSLLSIICTTFFCLQCPSVNMSSYYYFFVCNGQV